MNNNREHSIIDLIRINSNTNSILWGYFLFFVFIIQKYVSYVSDYGVYFSWFLIILLPFAFDLKNLKIIGLLLPFSLILYIFNKDIISIYFLFSFVYIFRNQPINRLAKLIVLCNFIYMILVIFLINNGILIDHVENARKGIAHDMGFGNSNVFGLFGYYTLISIYIWLFDKSRTLTYIVLLSLNELIYYYSGSRTSYGSGLVLIVCAIIYNFGLFRNWTRYVIAIFPVILTCVIYYILLNAEQFGALNIFLSKRISILSGCLSEINGVKIFTGNVFEGEPIDCAYVGVVFSGGIFFLLFFLFSFSYAIIKRFKRIRYYIPVLISIVISGMGENTFCSPMPSIVLFWLILLTKSPSIKSKKHIVEYIHLPLDINLIYRK